MFPKILILLAFFTSFCACPQPFAADFDPKTDKNYKTYIDYFEKVYKLFQDNYYLPPDRKVYDHFIAKFNQNIYAQLKSEGKSIDYVKWRSAWYLVDELRSKDDKFTGFWPPKPAVAFNHDVLAQKVDLGIEGKKNDLGFLVTNVEPHADAYAQGLRTDDIILKIDGQSVQKMGQDTIVAKLTPVVKAQVKLAYLSAATKMPQTITVTSKEYFKQTVFLRPVPVPGVFCLEITHFNEMTPDDMDHYLSAIRPQNPKGLVLDLRGNPGGQLGGALEISSYFLKGGDEFAYFLKRNQPKYDFQVPTIDPSMQITCPIIILVDDGTGSCAELFAGIMQDKKRAYVMGVNTAGQILLKNSFPMGDGSEIGLVVARAYYPDGKIFGFDGITPNKIISDAPKDGLRDLAAALIAATQAHQQ